MRIEALRLNAFGPFSDDVLDLSGGSQGLHLIYGRNEAGKSTALRALRGLLFGIPPRSKDNFLHPYTKMRIGGVLRLNNDRVVELTRRKGIKNTLHGPDEGLIDEQWLQHQLGGIDSALFSTMFGIGHEDLTKGGREIIQGGGNLGQLIFSAGSGIVDLHEIQQEIQMEMNQLFRPAGRKPKVNAMLNRLKSGRNLLKETLLPGRQWEKHDQNLKEAIKHKAVLERKRTAFEKDINRFSRIRDALPILVRRNELLKEFEVCRHAPILSEDFTEKRRDLMGRLSLSQSDKNRAEKTIEACRKSISAYPLEGIILDNAQRIEMLYQELGSQRKAGSDRIRLQTLRSTLNTEAREILTRLRDDLSLEEAANLTIRRSESVLIQELGARYERITTRLENSREIIPKLAFSAKMARERLDDVPPPAPIDSLHTALEEAEGFGPLEKHNQDDMLEIRKLFSSAVAEQERLQLGHFQPEMLERLRTPSLETVRVYEEQFDRAADSINELERDIVRIQDRAGEISLEISSVDPDRGVPSEEDLLAARRKRDRTWQIILSELTGERTPENNAGERVKKFEEEMRIADTLGDRLRREADRVASKAILLTEQKTIENKSLRLKERLKMAGEKKCQFADTWEAEWQGTGVRPRTPKEMEAWLKEFKALTGKLTEASNRFERCSRLKDDIEKQRENLRTRIENAGIEIEGEASLPRLIAVGAGLVAEQEQHKQRRKEIQIEIDRLEKDLAEERLRLASYETSLNDWRVQWKTAVKPIGLAGEALPKQATAVLEELNVFFEKMKEGGILEKRIEGIDRDARAFSQTVGELASKTGPESKGRSSEEIVLDLHRRMKLAREAQAKQDSIAKQIEREDMRQADAEQNISVINAQLAAMCSEAGCEDVQLLPEREKQSSLRKNVQEQLNAAEEQLHRLSAGATIDQFASLAQSIEPDAIDSEIRSLSESLQHLNTEMSELDQTIGSERAELKRMNGSAEAALIEEENQVLMGGLSREVDNYARLKIAAKVLAMAIERFRDKTQGPVLKNASGLFQKITGGSFDMLRAEFNTDGLPVLVGIRSRGGDIVEVDGMSDGTADQLFLALRLSGLSVYLENNDPIPFVMDDTLIKFDDNRAVAALETLAEFSAKTQVIYFTHHRHLVEIAEKHIDPSGLFVRELA